jgi:hypothetical protein
MRFNPNPKPVSKQILEPSSAPPIRLVGTSSSGASTQIGAPGQVDSADGRSRFYESVGECGFRAFSVKHRPEHRADAKKNNHASERNAANE